MIKLSVTTLTLCTLMILQPHANADKLKGTLHLHNRNIQILETPIDASLKEALQKPDNLPILGIVWLKQLPSSILRSELQQHGISLQTYLGEHVYYAEIDRTTEPQNWPKVILWAGAMAPEDKLETALWQKNFSPWAITESGLIKILVSFRRQTTQEAINSILSKYCSSYSQHDNNEVWRTQIDPDSIVKLAADPHVRFIEQGPHPMQPLQRDE